MSSPRSKANERAERALTELLSESQEHLVGVVMLSYRPPGAGPLDVSYGQASGMRAGGELDFVMLPIALRQLADQIEAKIKNPTEFLACAVPVQR